MKQLFKRIQTTVRAFQLLSEPELVSKLYREIEEKKNKELERGSKLIFHKHFVVQVMN